MFQIWIIVSGEAIKDVYHNNKKLDFGSTP